VALAICGFPEERVPRDVLARIFRGGRDKAAEAGCAIAGGHTVLDPELKYGLCVLGSVDLASRLTQRGAHPGDRLVLTKPLGMGVAAQAIKRGELAPADLDRVVAVMAALNRGARDAALAAGARAATDVTGFGLLGHLHHLLLGSRLAGRVTMERVPVLEFAQELAERGLVPGGSRRNLAYVAPHVRFDPGLGETGKLLLADAQTSGGLLLAVPPESVQRLVAELERRGTFARAVIGEVVEGPAGHIEVESRA
jgi:selenide,water dikinase